MLDDKISSQVGQIAEKSNRAWIMTILHIVFKFQFDNTCFHEGAASANFGGKVEQK